MAVKVADTVAPLGNFPGMMAEHVVIKKDETKEKSLQAMYDDGELGGGGSTKNYNDLENKPSVNGVELEGDKSIEDLDLISADAGNALELGSDGKLVAKSGSGILSEGNVRGIRCTTALQGLTTANYYEVKFTYKDGDESMLSNGVLVAPSDGLYVMRFRPNGDRTDSYNGNTHMMVKVNNTDPMTAEGMLYTNSIYNQQNAFTRSGSTIAKLEKGDAIHVIYYTNHQFSNNGVAAEFYQISERTDGFIAEAEYVNPASIAGGVWRTVTYKNSTNTEVIKEDGSIVLPETGHFIVGWESLVPTTGGASHQQNDALAKGLSVTSERISYVNATGTASVMLGGMYILSGNAGEVFSIQSYSSTSISGMGYADQEPKHVRIFRAGGSVGGQPGTFDYDELENKPSINSTEIVGDLSTEDLNIISEDDNNAITLGEDGNLFVEDTASDMERLEMKTDRINIAQKTVNDVGSYELLEAPQVYTITGATSTGTPKATDISKDIVLKSSIQEFDKVEITGVVYQLGGSGPLMYAPKTISLQVPTIEYNPTNTQSETAKATIYFNLDTATTTSGSYGSYTHMIQLWFKNETTLFVKQVMTPRPNNNRAEIVSVKGVKDRSVTVDPVNYVNTTSGIEDTPVGHILSHMGKTAPNHYLVCDGKEYNITNYRYLAQFIKDEYGSFNYFGGDGQTTFAVPDLRGEFLRGSGENSHENQGSGASVGEHQDGTWHNNIAVNRSALMIYASVPAKKNFAWDVPTKDSVIESEKNSQDISTSKLTLMNRSSQEDAIFTSRPTNTSVLYCIKYEPTYFMKVDGGGGGSYTLATKDDIKNIFNK